MFITLTIDTTRKKKGKIRLHKKKFNPASGWRRAIHIKKRTMWQRIKAWRKNSAKVSSALLSGNFGPRVQVRTLRSKFPCLLSSDTFAESSISYKLDDQIAMF